MAKLRAFQLAQELGIENKEFLQVMSSIGIPLKSHMSSIEESEVEAIKEKIANFKRGRTIETRVKGSIIRRRAAPTKPEPAPAPAPEPVPPSPTLDASSADAAAEAPVAEGPAGPAEHSPASAPYDGLVASPPAVPAEPAISELGKRRTDREELKPKKKGLKPVQRKAKEVIDVLPEEVPTLARRGPAWRGGAQPAGPAGSGQGFAPSRPTFRKRTVIKKEARKTEITTPKASKRVVKVSGEIAVQELAKRMGVKAGDVLRKLVGLGMMVNINATIDFDAAGLVAQEFGYEVENIKVEVESLLTPHAADRPEDLAHRPPTVTVMGHVDHGKTSLLDAIRSTNVTGGEAGGITQHIGAYHVRTPKGNIVFLDTPGHEAFTAMRARGAQVTDIVVLVVAADDGVMPQTIEAVDHAKAAGVPIMVAINKIDKPGADPERIKYRLMEFGLVPEASGGDTICALVSAKEKTGIDELLESILLQAEVMELKASPKKLAAGVVIEARLDKGRGPVATVLVREGTLRRGDAIVAGTQYGRVRALLDDLGRPLDTVTPGLPAEVLGLSGVPMAGEPFNAAKDERSAKEVADYRAQRQREGQLAGSAKVSLEDLFNKISTGETKDLRLVIKGDTQGSVEAVGDALRKLSGTDVQVRVIHGAVGGVSESDVMLASASDALVIGFNVRPDPKTQSLAEQEEVQIKLYTVIYDAVDDVRKAMEGLLAPTLKEKITGRAEVRNTFTVQRIGTIAGCMVTEGTITRASQVRLIRDSVVAYEGRIGSLRRFKDDVREVPSGTECGIKIENYNDVKVGDVIEAYSVEEFASKLQSSSPAPSPSPSASQ
ncbi:MAG: hypothetical protein A2Y95_01450 [Deltaproteobacteria bacterium RBG_13_65_10]|nr:MAG: hypothetical protein A2Y95_01450 [Deltaproteobacteria bacterium RBG_13_65_10]